MLRPIGLALRSDRFSTGRFPHTLKKDVHNTRKIKKDKELDSELERSVKPGTEIA